MKKALCFVIAIGMALSISACGNEAGLASDSGNETREEREAHDREEQEDDEKDIEDDKVESGIEDDELGSDMSDENESDDKETDDEEDATPENSDIDLEGLSSKHGRAYVYVWTGTESLCDGTWEFNECDGYIYDEDKKLERTLTIYRYSDTSAIEYMLEFAGEWGEYWHVSYDFPADCTYYDYIEGGAVTVSGSTATWEAEWGDYREIYTLKETHEFDD